MKQLKFIDRLPTKERFNRFDGARRRLADFAIETLMNQEDFAASIQRKIDAGNAALTDQAARLHEVAYHDTLTDIPNRAGLEHYFRERSKDMPDDTPVRIVSIDVNGLKEINDRYGHAAGDAYIENGAATISSVIREGDIVARAGGDEFYIVQFPHDKRETAETGDETPIAERIRGAADRIVTRINERLREQGMLPITISFAAGVGETTVGELRASESIPDSEAFHRADEAMYRNKREIKAAESHDEAA